MTLSPIFSKIAFTRSFIWQFPCRGFKRLFQPKSIFETPVDRGLLNAVRSASGRNAWVGNIVHCYRLERALIKRALLAQCRPLAIAWLVVSRWVKPVDGVFEAWPLAHIRKKIFKGRIPTFAYGYPNGTVFRVIFEFIIKAPSLHTKPNSIGRADLSVPFVAVFKVGGIFFIGHLNNVGDHHIKGNSYGNV